MITVNVRINVDARYTDRFVAPTFTPTDTPNVVTYEANIGRRGDDESIVWELWSDLPDDVPHEMWEIDWDNTDYK